MGKITFTNKNKAGTGDVTLWKDTDANEVKTSVNAVYDTTLTIAGTTNQVSVAGGTQNLEGNRTWTLSLPQNIHTSATPTFGSLTINGESLTSTTISTWNNTATNLNTHTGDTTIHFTQASISITKSQVSDFGTYQEPLVSGTNIKTINNESLLGDGNITIEGGEGGASQLTDLNDVTLTSPSTGQLLCRNSSGQWINWTPDYGSGGVSEAMFNTHTGDTTIHFTQAQISITESQISDLGIYATAANLSSHTGDTTIHFTQASISITESQISDLKSYVEGVNTAKITVAATAPNSPATGDLWVDTSA